MAISLPDVSVAKKICDQCNQKGDNMLVNIHASITQVWHKSFKFTIEAYKKTVVYRTAVHLTCSFYLIVLGVNIPATIWSMLS